MKKFLVLGSVFISLNLFAAAEPDLRKGLDFTYTNVATASMLNQLVDNGTIWNSGSITNARGIVMRSTIRPDVTNNPRYTNWLWLDMTTATNGVGTLKQYVCCGNADTNWVTATIGNGVIVAANIADYTITESKMATNSVNQYALQANTVSGNKISDNGILPGKLTAFSVTNGNYAPRSITGGDIAVGTLTNGLLVDNTITSNKIASETIIGFNVLNQSLNSNDIAYGGIMQTNIAAGNITYNEIANSTIRSNNMAANSVNASLVETNLLYGVPVIWGNFTVTSGGAGPATLRKALGVSSVTWVKSGYYKVDFITARSGTNYCVNVTSYGQTATPTKQCGYTSNTVSSVTLVIEDSAGGVGEASQVSFSINDF